MNRFLNQTKGMNMKTKRAVVSPEDNATLSSMGFKLCRHQRGVYHRWFYLMHDVSLKGVLVAHDHKWKNDTGVGAVLYVNAGPDAERAVFTDRPFAAGCKSLPGNGIVGFDNIIEAATFLRLHVIEEERRRLGELADAIKAGERP